MKKPSFLFEVIEAIPLPVFLCFFKVDWSKCFPSLDGSLWSREYHARRPITISFQIIGCLSYMKNNATSPVFVYFSGQTVGGPHEIIGGGRVQWGFGKMDLFGIHTSYSVTGTK